MLSFSLWGLTGQHCASQILLAVLAGGEMCDQNVCQSKARAESQSGHHLPKFYLKSEIQLTLVAGLHLLLSECIMQTWKPAKKSICPNGFMGVMFGVQAVGYSYR